MEMKVLRYRVGIFKGSKAMIAAAQGKAQKQILRSEDINTLATQAS